MYLRFVNVDRENLFVIRIKNCVQMKTKEPFTRTITTRWARNYDSNETFLCKAI